MIEWAKSRGYTHMSAMKIAAICCIILHAGLTAAFGLTIVKGADVDVSETLLTLSFIAAYWFGLVWFVWIVARRETGF